MKKVLFTTALFLTACAVSAQESVVKEAKSAKSDPVKAAQIIEPAVVILQLLTILKHGSWLVISRKQFTMRKT